MRPSTGEKTDYRGWRYWVNVIPSPDNSWTFFVHFERGNETRRELAAPTQPTPRGRKLIYVATGTLATGSTSGERFYRWAISTDRKGALMSPIRRARARLGPRGYHSARGDVRPVIPQQGGELIRVSKLVG